MSNKEVGIEQARKTLGDLAIAAQYGHTTILTRNGTPIARIAPLEDAVTTQQDDSDRTEYALCWESAGPDSAWVIRVRKPSMSDWDLWMSNPVEDLDEDDYQYAKQWAEECLALEEGLTVESWKRDKDGDWIPAFAATVTAMTATDLRDHVTTATDAAEGEYDVDAIVAEIGETYGYDVDPERIDTAEYWAIVGRHATA